MKAVMIAVGMLLCVGCAGVPEGKRVEMSPATTPHSPMLCRRSTVKIDGQYEVVMICRPVPYVPPDAHDTAPKHKI